MAKKLYGTDPDQVPTNADLGTIAYQDSENVNLVKDSGAALTINRKTDDGDLALFRKDTSLVGSIGTTGGDLIIGTGDTGLYFYDGATSVIPWKISTNALSDGYSDLGHPSYRWKDLYLSGGVVFGDAGGSGTPTSNTLDSYEEGTWTPSFGADGSNPTMTYSAQVGRYTKIGNLVTAYCQIITASRSGGSGALTVDGLPFTVAPAVTFASATIGFNYNWNTPPLNAGAQGSTTHVILYQDATTNTGATPVDIVASGNSYFYFVVSYETTL
jgi:hypothetical protein